VDGGTRWIIPTRSAALLRARGWRSHPETTIDREAVAIVDVDRRRATVDTFVFYDRSRSELCRVDAARELALDEVLERLGWPVVDLSLVQLDLMVTSLRPPPPPAGAECPAPSRGASTPLPQWLAMLPPPPRIREPWLTDLDARSPEQGRLASLPAPPARPGWLLRRACELAAEGHRSRACALRGVHHLGRTTVVILVALLEAIDD
jgi:hypothetical protein